MEYLKILGVAGILACAVCCSGGAIADNDSGSDLEAAPAAPEGARWSALAPPGVLIGYVGGLGQPFPYAPTIACSCDRPLSRV